MTPISIEAVQQELARYGVIEAPVEGFTAREWAEQWNCSTNKARTLIGKCLDCGLMASGQIHRPRRLDGVLSIIPVYRLVKSTKKARAAVPKKKN